MCSLNNFLIFCVLFASSKFDISHTYTINNDDLVSLYEYYTSGGITEGLNADNSYFTLNKRNITIFSGSWHYFRIEKLYWRDRLRRMRAAGLNAMATYIPWNLHEPQPGLYEFGAGRSDYRNFLDLEYLFQSVQGEDMFLIIRPGPYICAEWEYGGFPSWLVKEKNITLRSSDETYMLHVRRYFEVLMPLLAKYQFQNGGPIIAFQVENEYGSVPNPDLKYMEALVSLMKENGIKELLITADQAVNKDRGSVPEALKTVTFKDDPAAAFEELLSFQPNRPVMAMEFYSGWFDVWGEPHQTLENKDFYEIMDVIVKFPASVNILMFQGGTNFGFLNGAEFNSTVGFQPVITSYDFDAPLTEAGGYTIKYQVVTKLLEHFNPIQTSLPDPPDENYLAEYPSANISFRLPLYKVLDSVPNFEYENVINMEELPINNNNGQQYGYIVYRKTGLNIEENSTLLIEGRVHDSVVVLVNNILVSKPLKNIDDLNSFGFWRKINGTLNFGSLNVTNATLDLIVQNWGRISYGDINPESNKKGIWEGNVLLNNKVLKNWTIYPLEFGIDWINNLSGWEPINITAGVPPGPAFYKTEFYIRFREDTFIKTDGWNTGFMAVNGNNIGRYCPLGPQRYLYLPFMFLLPVAAVNQFVIFDNYLPNSLLEFSDHQIFNSTIKSV